MTDRGLPALLLPLCSLFVSAAVDVTKPAAMINSSGVNSTVSGGSDGQSRGGGDGNGDGGVFGSLGVDSSMMQRALYVLIGFTMIGLLYFLIRAVRLKKPVQRKKYGLLLNDSVEMEAVESEEDDDTLFEARGLRR